MKTAFANIALTETEFSRVVELEDERRKANPPSNLSTPKAVRDNRSILRNYETKLESLVGQERYFEYVLGYDVIFRSKAAALTPLGIGIPELIRLRWAEMEASDATTLINMDLTMSAESRMKKVAELHGSLSQQVRGLLGEKAAETYFASRYATTRFLAKQAGLGP